MWSLGGILIVALTLGVVALSHWMYKWRNPNCNGILPPGSMGLPLVGETFPFFTISKSVDIPPFIKNRLNKYGRVFKTSLVGRPVVVSSDPEFNHYILQQEGKLVEIWYMDSLSKLIGMGDDAEPGSIPTTSTGQVHKFIRNSLLSHIGIEKLKENILPKMEDASRKILHAWATTSGSIDVKRGTSTMMFDFTANLLFGYEPKKSNDKNMSEMFTYFLQGVMSFPLNIPGTTFHRCLQNKKLALQLMKDLMDERIIASPEKRRGDFLDHCLDARKTENFLTDDFIAYLMFGLQFANETISSTLCLAIIYLSNHPRAVKELKNEQEGILRNRKEGERTLTWNEYKSMTFTMHVVNESLRMASVGPGILRRAIVDIPVNGYTIPKGWTIMVVPSALQLNPETFDDPLSFNPWRWKDLGPSTIAKNFIPFGGGMRTCAGAEFSKAFMAVFFHVFVSNYKWEKVKGGEITRTPFLGFGDGFHIKVSKKDGDGEHKLYA